MTVARWLFVTVLIGCGPADLASRSPYCALPGAVHER
jgi:hypothetical protein